MGMIRPFYLYEDSKFIVALSTLEGFVAFSLFEWSKFDSEGIPLCKVD